MCLNICCLKTKSKAYIVPLSNVIMNCPIQVSVFWENIRVGENA